MKTTLLQVMIPCLFFYPLVNRAQADLTIGLNYAYDPTSSCDNKIKNLSVDICNNNATSASNFEVGIYLFNPANNNKWIVASVNVTSLGGNACRTISNWNIDMNNFCCLPAPGTAYRIGVWADTANVVTESTKNNNASLLSGNIQICGKSTSLPNLESELDKTEIFPNPASESAQVHIKTSSNKKLGLSVSNAFGKEIVRIYDGDFDTDSGVFEIPTAALTNGLYFITVTQGGEKAVKKIIVSH